MSSSIARYFPGSIVETDISSRVEARSRSTKESQPDVVETVDELSDEVLISQICANSHDAFTTLFRRYAKAVRALSYRVLHDVAEADEMVQEVFILVYRNCASFDSVRGPAKLWLFQIAYHRAISRRRYLTARHYYQGVDLDDAAFQVVDPKMTSAAIEHGIDMGLKGGQLNGIFSDLSKDQQQTLRLFFIEGYTFDEIAAKLGHTRGNVKNHYFRGLEKLRKALFGSKLPGERAV